MPSEKRPCFTRTRYFGEFYFLSIHILVFNYKCQPNSKITVVLELVSDDIYLRRPAEGKRMLGGK